MTSAANACAVQPAADLGRGPLFWVRVALGLGLLLRLFYYLHGLSVWGDEAALILNVLGKSFTELLGPLFFQEAAPPGFLWLEKGVTLILGDSPCALRLIPFLASCLTLLLFTRLAWCWLTPAAVPWAVLFMACSDRLLWHSCEAKPYMMDVLMATIVLLGFASTRDWGARERFLLWTALAPGLIWLVFPGGFLCGGLLLAELPALWRDHRRGVWLAYGLWVALVGLSFLLLLLGPIHAQKTPGIEACWSDMFPDLSQPWWLPLWAIGASLHVAQYALNPTGEYLGILALLPIVALWKYGPRSRLVILIVPPGLALIASLFHAYPYCRSRVMAYAAPAVLLLIAEGCRQTWQWLWPRQRLLAGFVVVLMLMPLANTAHRLLIPWERADAGSACGYVLSRLQPGEQVYGNYWEFGYYFRSRPAGCPYLEGQMPRADRAAWVLIGCTSPSEREKLFGAAGAGRTILERREFHLVTVAHLSPRQIEGAAMLRR